MDFNPTKSSLQNLRTENYEDGLAYSPASPELGLYKVVINNLLEDTYYREDIDAVREVAHWFERAADEDPEFPLQLAAYARQEMYLRDVPQLLLVLAANHEQAREYAPTYGPAIIRRADELCTSTAVQLTLFGKPLPKPLKRAINRSFHNFDRYQFAKYENSRREVSIQDVMNLTHPRPETPEEEEIFRRLIRGPLDDYPDVEPLEPPHTWEVVISERGNTADAWREVLPDMGIFATIRNLRNMLQAGLSGEEILEDELLDQVRESKLYPFRFYQSYRALKDADASTPHVEEWLSAAVDFTAENLPDELGDTFVGVDLSGSMTALLSEHSTLSYLDISSFFGAVLMKQGADVGAFATDFERVSAHYRTPTLELVEKIRATEVGGATNGWKVLRDLTGRRASYDRVVILTDMQIWDSTWFGSEETVKGHFERYRREVNPEANLYMLDLSSYGDLVTPEGYKGVYNVSGWNSKIVDFVLYAEDENEIVEEVRAVEPPG